jgi:RND family efflux transporter MFP subunit
MFSVSSLVKRRKRTGEHKMRILKLALIALILCSIVIPPISCGKTTETIPESQLAAIKRGDLTVDITAVGNLAYSVWEDLGFEIGGTTAEPLSVEEVLVQEGDTVKEGQALATLDTTSLQKSIKAAEIALEKATDSWRKVTYPYTYKTLSLDIPASNSLIGDAQRELNEALKVMQELGLSREQYDWKQYWDVWHNLTKAQDDLNQAKENLRYGQGPDLFGENVIPMADYWTLKAAQLDMEQAQDTLDIAKDRIGKTVIAAPFDGFVTTVNVKGGDQVQRGTVAMRLVDPNKFEAEVMVSEMDIFQVKLGGDATVQIDAMPTLVLPAKVTFISPTATIQSGVVNYQVKVEVQPLEKDFQLREGLTVTVSILEERKDVLLVPNAAITTQGEKTYVQVVSPTGTTEQRVIQTGVTDYQYTEVTSGLSEGEKVVVPKGTTTTSTTQQGTSGGMPFFEP